MFLTGSALAQDAATEELVPPAKWTKKQIESPPVRELKVDVTSEAYQIPVKDLEEHNSAFRSLDERKFMAVLQIVVPTPEGRLRNWSSSLDRTSMQAARFDGGYLLFPGASSRATGGSNLTQFKNLLTHVATGALDKETAAFFQSEYVDHGLLLFISQRRSTDGTIRQEFRIFGKSAEECERRVKGLLTLLDYGFSRPLQLKLLQKREELEGEVKTSKKELQEAQAELERVARRITEFNDFTVDMLPVLRQQQMALEVDLAGTVARVKACDRLLESTRPALSPERRASVEDTKIQAEIDLSGFQAKRTTLLEFLVKAKEKSDLTNRQRELQDDIMTARQVISSRPRQCQDIDVDLDFVAPVKVVDDKFLIQPIKWISPQPPGQPEVQR